jgi:UDP-xylose/UDP-N-acetylglucosamine transporter B4
VVFLELLVRQDSGIGNLVTFSQFLVIAVEGFFFTTKCGTVGPKVPFKSWIVLVVMYFLVSVTNNYALSYHVPMPLHMVFRAGSLMANMLMGMVLLGKRYKPIKYVSVLMITIGIATCTVMSATSRVSLKTGKAVFTEEGETTEKAMEELLAAQSERLRELMMGIGLLVFAMLMSARMGIYQVRRSLGDPTAGQEVVYGRHGKHAKEALFYTHALPLPGFLLLGPDIMHHWQVRIRLGLSLCPSATVSLPLCGRGSASASVPPFLHHTHP